MTAIYSTILGYLITINLIRAMAHKLWSSSTLRIFTLWVPLKRVPQRWIFMQNHSSQATLKICNYKIRLPLRTVEVTCHTKTEARKRHSRSNLYSHNASSNSAIKEIKIPKVQSLKSSIQFHTKKQERATRRLENLHPDKKSTCVSRRSGKTEIARAYHMPHTLQRFSLYPIRSTTSL